MEVAFLSDIAHGRSGDKGNHANIAVIAYTPQASPGCANISPPRWSIGISRA